MDDDLFKLFFRQIDAGVYANFKIVIFKRAVRHSALAVPADSQIGFNIAQPEKRFRKRTVKELPVVVPKFPFDVWYISLHIRMQT
jgi:hypothetical protein